MEEEGRRHSDRISLGFRIRISGVDSGGQQFSDETQTVVVSRFGAKVKLARGLLPHQEIVVLCVATGKEAIARVVGQVGVSPDGYAYGIEILDPTANLWGIAFPPPGPDDEPAGGRAVLECMACHSREVMTLNDLELEVFQQSERLSRSCERCGEVTLWGPCEFEAPYKPTAPRPPRPAEVQETPNPLEITPRTQNDREASRLRMTTPICVRTPLYGEDVGTTEDVSKGGFRFKSPQNYTVGSLVEVAIPYTPTGANIFVAARIAWRQDLPDFGVVVYGASYIARRKAPSVRAATDTPETQG